MPEMPPEDERYVRHVGDGSRFTLVHAFSCARAGLKYAVSSQRNFKVHALFALLAIVLGFILRIGTEGWLAIVLCMMAVLSFELINTAVESVVDLVSLEWSQLAKHAKDCAAASVYVAALTSLVVAAIVFIPPFCALIGLT